MAFFQNSSGPIPIGETIPSPVMTGCRPSFITDIYTASKRFFKGSERLGSPNLSPRLHTDLQGVRRRVKSRDTVNTGLAGDQVLPEGILPIPGGENAPRHVMNHPDGSFSCPSAPLFQNHKSQRR